MKISPRHKHSTEKKLRRPAPSASGAGRPTALSKIEKEGFSIPLILQVSGEVKAPVPEFYALESKNLKKLTNASYKLIIRIQISHPILLTFDSLLYVLTTFKFIVLVQKCNFFC